VGASAQSASADAPNLPTFGGANGWLYPGLAWVLDRLTRLTVPRALAFRPAATDAYVVGCVAAVLAVVALDWIAVPAWGWYGAAVFVYWRLFELCSVTSFEFFVGSTREYKGMPLCRVVALKTVN
jgi:hypothetical protein